VRTCHRFLLSLRITELKKIFAIPIYSFLQAVEGFDHKFVVNEVLEKIGDVHVFLGGKNNIAFCIEL